MDKVFCKNCRFVAKGSVTDEYWKCIKAKILNSRTGETYLGYCKDKNWACGCEDYKEIPK